MACMWHRRDVDKYGMSVYGSRKGAPAQAIYISVAERLTQRLYSASPLKRSGLVLSSALKEVRHG
jgi:hypothetical protein